MPSNPALSCSRLSAVPPRKSPPSGNMGIDTSIACSQSASRNGAPLARANANVLVFIARHHARIGVEGWRVREQHPERVVSTRRHRARTKVPNRAAARGVLHVQDL